MAFDGFVTKKIVTELEDTILGAKVNKILQPNANQLLLGLYSSGKNRTLLIDCSSSYYRFHLTTTSKPNPITPLHFCMVLRKHLVGCRIKSIASDGLERVVVIEFEGYNELNDFITKKLIIELMGKYSNVVLTNGENKIIDSLKHFDRDTNTCRSILPAHEYVFLESSKKDFCSTSLKEFEQDISLSDSTAKEVASTYNGMSERFVAYQLSTLETATIPCLYQTLTDILSHLSTSSTGCVAISEGNDFVLTRVTPTENSLSTNLFLDHFYEAKEKKDLLTSYRSNLLKLVLSALTRVSKKMVTIQTKLKECEKMDIYRIYGELLTSNLYRFSSKERPAFVELENFYQNNEVERIPLDTAFSPSDNAKKYFKKYHKLKNALEIVTLQKKEVEQNLDYLESIVYELENANSLPDLDEIYEEITETGILKQKEPISISEVKRIHSSKGKKKLVATKKGDPIVPLFYTIDGFSFYLGKNNKQNDIISTKMGKNEDLWFHTKDIHGSHGLLKCDGSSEKVTRETILSCAKLVASHSKAKLSSQVPVDYCFVKYVKKPSGSKPGMVIYTHQKTVYVTP